MSDLFPNFLNSSDCDHSDQDTSITITEHGNPFFDDLEYDSVSREYTKAPYILPSHFLDDMNPAQREAVLFDQGSLLVLSGAGSGKTRVITHRFAHLMQKYQLELHNILCVTFTNKAAQEMRHRILNLLSLNQSNMWIKTFHSMCLNILKNHADHIGYSKNFTIYDSADTKSSIKKIFEQLHIDPKQYSDKAIIKMIASAKDNLISPRDFLRTAQGEIGAICAEVYTIYQESLRQNQAMDFNDLITNALILLQDNATIRTFYQEQWQFIMADEFQDTNKSQYTLLKLLSRNLSNVCVVGDDDQSIYGWRGAQVSNIRQFQEECDAHVIRLEINYRSSGNIVKAASAVVESIDGRMPKNLQTSRDNGDKVSVANFADDRMQAAYVYQQIKDLIAKKGYSYKNFAILYRTNAQSRIVEEVLMRHQVPYIIYGGQRFFDRAEIKDMLAYLRLIVNPNDSEAFGRIVNIPKRRIGNISQEKLIQFTMSHSLNYIESCVRAAEIEGLNRSVVSSLASLSQILSDLRDCLFTDKPSDLLKKLIDKIEYFHLYLLVEHGENGAEERMRNIEELLNAMKIFETNEPSGTLIDFLQEASLLSEMQELESGQESVSLMTIHSAKGLEFDVVFVIGLVEGILPIVRSAQSESEINEEKRLFYVAVTRAKNQLYLTYELQSLRFGEISYNRRSHFFDFLPKDILIEKTVLHPTDSTISTKKSFSDRQCYNKIKHTFPKNLKTKAIQSLDELVVGDQVVHTIFGPGTVDYVSHAMVKVLFDNFGIQVLMGNVVLNLKKVI